MNKECSVYLELLCPLSLELFLWTTLHGVRSGDSSPPSTAVDELSASLRERELLGARFATTWRIDRLSRFAGFHLTFLDSTASCDSAYLTSHLQIIKVNRKSKITAGCCFLFSEEISPRKNQHATEARSLRRRKRPGIWSPRAAKTSTNPNKYSATVQIRAQRQPSD